MGPADLCYVEIWIHPWKKETAPKRKGKFQPVPINLVSCCLETVVFMFVASVGYLSTCSVLVIVIIIVD